jgi:hypothetical protein
MEEGQQNSKRLSYMAKFKCEAVRCAEEKGNHKTTAFFEVDESNIRLWWKHMATTSNYEAQTIFTGPKKGLFFETDDTAFMFFSRKMQDLNKLYCSYSTYSGFIIFPKSSSQLRI